MVLEQIKFNTLYNLSLFGDMMVYDEEYIRNKMMGSLAEELFRVLHTELKCQVFRTGHEFLFPNMLDIANLSKKAYHKAYAKEDYIPYLQNYMIEVFGFFPNFDFEDIKGIIGKEAIDSGFEEIDNIHYYKEITDKNILDSRWKKWNLFCDRLRSIKDLDRLNKIVTEYNLEGGVLEPMPKISDIGKMRFHKSEHVSLLAKSPDFTIITPGGNIYQFEVKYRKNGILTREEYKGYLSLASKPFIFVVSSQEPYIKILVPAHGYMYNSAIEEKKKFELELERLSKKIFDEEIKERIAQLPNRIPNPSKPSKEELEYQEKRKFFENWFTDSEYIETKREKDGTLDIFKNTYYDKEYSGLTKISYSSRTYYYPMPHAIFHHLLPSERFIYDAATLSKYEKIIQRLFAL